MKNLLLVICKSMTVSLIFYTSFLYSQQSDSLIQLYPGLGDTIDVFENEFFNIYSNVRDFQAASVYIRDGSKLVSRMKLKSPHVSLDSTIIHSLTILDKIRSNLNKIEIGNDKKSELKTRSRINLKDNRTVLGELRMFSKSDLYLEVDNEQPQININSGVLKIPINKVDEIVITGQDKTWASAGWGALTGMALGGIIGFASGDGNEGFIQFTKEEKALGWGLIWGVIGGVIGLISGISSSTEDHTIEYNSTLDLLKLKDYAKYNFREEETIENKYKVLE